MAKKATDFGYCAVSKLASGTRIYFYGWREVIDVQNVSKAQGGPQKVKLSTSDGTFLMDRNTLIATEAA